MLKHMNRLSLLILIAWLIVACDSVNEPASTATPTAGLSAPLLQASATIEINPLTRVAPNVTPLFNGVTDPTIAALPAHGQVPPIQVTQSADTIGETASGGINVLIPMPSGEQLLGTAFEAQIPDSSAEALPDGGQPLRRVAGVLLLGGAINEWGQFPVLLRAGGYSVLHMNLPDNGGTVNDFNSMLRALSEMGTVDPARIAVIGATLGADVGLIGCSLNELCDTIVLLSPQSRDTLLNVMITYNPRPLMLTASREDTSYGVAQAIQNAATGEVLLQGYDNAGRGTELLTNEPNLTETIITWLNRVFTN